MVRFTAIFWVGIIFLGLFGGVAAAQERQIVAGAGPSEEICKLFFTKFNELEGVEDYRFFVMEGSIKHNGGILNSNKYLFGRTGRPLKEEEKALGKKEIFLGQVPIAFAKGLEVNVSKLTMEQIEKIFTGQIKNWQDVGGQDAAILLVGREPTEALFLALKEEYPSFKEVQFEKTFNRDDEVTQFLSSPYGRHAIAFGQSLTLAKSIFYRLLISRRV